MSRLLLWAAVNLACGFFWVFAVIVDARASRILWVVVDVFLPPVGVIRGIWLWL